MVFAEGRAEGNPDGMPGPARSRLHECRRRAGAPLLAARLFLLASIAGLPGCAATSPEPQLAPKDTVAASATATTVAPSVDYLMQVGDQIELKLYYHPELNETITIRPDGKISLQLVGEVMAAGRSPEALSKDLVELYSRQGLRSPSVAVLLRKSAGQRVFVGGEVGSPRMVTHEGRLTLSQAVIDAGGFKSTANRSAIVLLRDHGDGGAVVTTVNFDKDVLKAGRDIPLQPYDIVIVPQSGIARANQFVEQYLSRMIPTWLTFGFSYVLGSTVVVGD
jgi:protein involved in polysaccharide export with SLBB domain